VCSLYCSGCVCSLRVWSIGEMLDRKPKNFEDNLMCCLFVTTEVVWTGLALKCSVTIIFHIALPDIQGLLA